MDGVVVDIDGVGVDGAMNVCSASPSIHPDRYSCTYLIFLISSSLSPFPLLDGWIDER